MSALRQGILSELRRGKSVRQILRGLGERKQGDQILAALEILAQGGVRLEGRDLTAGITTCGKLAQWRQALLLATSARSFQVQPSIFGYNAGISACERAGQWQRALQLLALMPAESLDPGVVSFSNAISALAKYGRWQQALGLFQQLRAKALAPDAICYSSFISACEKEGQWQRALSLFEAMESSSAAANVFSWSATISACAKGSEWSKALGLFALMPEKRVAPNTVTYGAAISACAKGSRWEQAVAWLSETRRLRALDVLSYSATIGACEKGSQWQRALGLFECMPRMQLRPNLFSFDAAINASQKGRQWQQALGFFTAMPRAQVAPDLYCYNAVLASLHEEWLYSRGKPTPGEFLRWDFETCQRPQLGERLPKDEAAMTPPKTPRSASSFRKMKLRWDPPALGLGFLSRSNYRSRSGIICQIISALVAAGRRLWRWPLEEAKGQLKPLAPESLLLEDLDADEVCQLRLLPFRRLLLLGARVVTLCTVEDPLRLRLLRQLRFETALSFEPTPDLAICCASEGEGAEMDLLLHGVVDQEEPLSCFSVSWKAPSPAPSLPAVGESARLPLEPALAPSEFRQVEPPPGLPSPGKGLEMPTAPTAPPGLEQESGWESSQAPKLPDSSDDQSGDRRAAGTVHELSAFMQKRAHRASDAVVQEVLRLLPEALKGASGTGRAAEILRECQMIGEASRRPRQDGRAPNLKREWSRGFQKKQRRPCWAPWSPRSLSRPWWRRWRRLSFWRS
ncbi:unnamed protein product [Effrenium voratum]|nr:unnamed protein product [Effrenium voratum]